MDTTTGTTATTAPDPLVIGLTGLAGTGKSTAAAYLVEHYGFHAMAFADALKSMLELHLVERSINYAWLHEPKLKELPIPGLNVSARQLMQTLGDWGRALHPDWWVLALADTAGLNSEPSQWAPVHDRLLITDVRYPNEAAWLRYVRGRLIRLHREDAAPARAHDSEQYVMHLQVDLELANHGPTTTGLHGLLDSAMRDCGIGPRPGCPYVRF